MKHIDQLHNNSEYLVFYISFRYIQFALETQQKDKCVRLWTFDDLLHYSSS